ncbi:MAG: VacJ family lipoprotein [Coxiellaceae bacterium]|nr:VacJ family lipoprotein [Coxiellaceae bacterium]
MKSVKWLLAPLACTALALITGCAKNPTSANDPLEPYNRFMFAANQDIDHLLIRPIAKTYTTVTPPPLQKGVTNFFDNTFELISFPNDFLQGNFKFMAVDFWRFFINSTLGVAGLFDVASRVGLPKHFEGFGMTLAKWRGGKSAPYFVIPVLGPSTIQAAIGLVANYYTTPWAYIKNDYIADIPPALAYINYRSQYLAADKLVETSFDPYTFVRDAYMQNESRRIAENQARGDNTFYDAQHNISETSSTDASMTSADMSSD